MQKKALLGLPFSLSHFLFASRHKENHLFSSAVAEFLEDGRERVLDSTRAATPTGTTSYEDSVRKYSEQVLQISSDKFDQTFHLMCGR